ncbi:NACHT domain-containing NTPase [Funiculus sociatus GB2-A5]|uniref:NACHT domain-containing NTPase n=1 Tax=Funiculus sociatus GB2-A5 TaxID=2933946 RepID=A0ABV0JL88_9CYAN|nr:MULTISPECIES: NACHT domain-containing NTPase [unclassified Trichocoleus]MBD1905793.1 NACHT domain-containing NTPase [Trichocoleus sp. FACHB-832]MBD2065934.1 NACHT domain-containing NTPase [Trichocoleus sp. FACHB-6]
MAERSIRASSEGIQKAKKVVKDQGWTQTQIGEQVGTSRQPVGKFFAGKPIERPTFIDICRLLDLDWEEIAEPEPEKQSQDTNIDIAALVQEVREKIEPIIQERCGTMRVLDMTHPIGLNDIYTNVNILEKITGRRRKEIAELLQECNFEDVERFGLGRIAEERVPGLKAVEKYPKLMILGKPGAGKTTFLKYLAQCNQGKFQADRVPISVTLKDFAEAANKPGLLEYITQQFAGYGVVETRVIASLQNVIECGRALILLDGLDEVREEDNKRVLKEIRDLSDQYRDNHFVITCRIAAREYTFEKFTEVEVADFDSQQIATFVTNWFKNKAVKAETFIERLEENERINELAASPLLLTLLCLAFEESGDFPANRSELYKEGLDALMKKWDAKRGIQRDQVYKKLSVQRKEDLLSKIALTTFDQGDYFFKQKVAEQYITDYIRNLPDANADPEALQLDSEVVLRSIEYQHGLLVERAKGIYSFSHLTFHEYFTAREIVFGTQPLEERLQNLVSHIAEKRWREVFLLAVGMSPSADLLLQLMKKQIDALIADDEKLQHFLMWVSQKSVSVEVLYKPATVRAFYLAFALDRNIYEMTLDTRLAHCLSRDLTNDFGDVLNSNSDCHPASGLVLDYLLLFELRLARDHALSGSGASKYALEPELKRSLKQLQEILKDQQPNLIEDTTGYRLWWKNHGQAWTEQLKNLMIKYRNIGHDWQLNKQQKEIFDHYYDANLLLVECLNSDCYVSREVRQEIEDTLLLPIAEIEQRKRESM